MKLLLNLNVLVFQEFTLENFNFHTSKSSKRLISEAES